MVGLDVLYKNDTTAILLTDQCISKMARIRFKVRISRVVASCLNSYRISCVQSQQHQLWTLLLAGRKSQN